MDDEPSFDLDAAGLRADSVDLATSIQVLAGKLVGALPDATTVRRRAKRLFGEKAVTNIEVQLDTTRYSLNIDGSHVTATCQHAVHGVIIKREELELADWVNALTNHLREQATDSAQARDALQRLLG
jgi:hypothetical protein